MKKGFTLVEMAIVIIVIGVIITMAVKGRDIMESSKVHHDMNKIKNIQAAIATYALTVQGNFPENFNSDNLNNDYYTTPTDYVIETAKQNITIFQAQPIEFSNTTQNKTILISHEGYGDTIAAMANNLTADENLYSSIELFRILFFGCNMDAILDDGVASTGLARIYNQSNSDSTRRLISNTRLLPKSCGRFLAPITTSGDGKASISNIMNSYGFMAIILF